jgi:hypothetical protein
MIEVEGDTHGAGGSLSVRKFGGRADKPEKSHYFS